MNPTLLVTHWRPILVGVLVLLAFAFGRYSAPKPSIKIVTQEHIVTKTVEVKGDTKEVVRNQVVYVDRIVHKDGTVEEKTETKTLTDTRDVKTDNVVVASVADVKQAVTITTARADWHVAALVGGNLSPAILVGAQVERRILGPIYVGAWGLVETSGKHPMAGLSVGVVF